MTKIRVLLVDDHAILRVGLVSYLRYQEDIQVVGEAENGTQALALVEQLRPDVAVMDIGMPGMNGIQATRMIRERFPETRVLILSQYQDQEYVLPLLQAGASGYILKSAMGPELLTALRAVAKGEIFLCRPVASVLSGSLRQPETIPSANDSALTPREQQILEQIAQGRTNTQIAAALSLSVNTIVWHRSNLMNKLGVHSVAELVRYAMQHGLLRESS
jgi:DNA-binding NarL/FixJ family response regulator